MSCRFHCLVGEVGHDASLGGESELADVYLVADGIEVHTHMLKLSGDELRDVCHLFQDMWGGDLKSFLEASGPRI